ncbi:MAG: MFS transporter [Candidatus Heimdallarchaeaceae archaeon]
MGEPKGKRRQSNIILRYWMSAVTLKTTAESIILPFLPLYGLLLNASLTTIGLLVAVNSLFGIAQILWAKYAETRQKLRITALVTNYCSAVFYFFFGLVPSIALLIAFRAVQSLIGSGFFPTSSALLTKRTESQDWGYWNSWIQASTVAGSLIGVLAGGAILYNPENKGSYILLFMLAGILSCLSAIMFHFSVPSQTRLEHKHKWVEIHETPVTMNNALAVMRTDKNFVILCIATFILVFGTNISGPFYIIFNTQFYDLTVMQSSILTAIGLVPQLILSLITYMFLDKLRKKELIIVTGIILSAFPLIYIIPYLTGHRTNVFGGFTILWILNGAAWGVANTAFTTLVLDIIHPGRRALQLAINNSVSAISLFLAPIFGGLITGAGVFYWVFIVSSLGRLLGIFVFKYVKEPIIGGTILRPLRRVFHIPVNVHLEKPEVVANIPVPRRVASYYKTNKPITTSELPIYRTFEKVRIF